MVSLVVVTHNADWQVPFKIEKIWANSNSYPIPNNPLLVCAIGYNGESLSEVEKKLNWQKPIKVGQLEVMATEESTIKLHEPTVSSSADSDALYIGESARLGVLIQYLGKDINRTGDIVAHTSLHGHEVTWETYYTLMGRSYVVERNIKTGEQKITELNGITKERLTIQPGWYHPLIAHERMPSLLLISANPPTITKEDHHYGGNFRDAFPDLANGVQK